MVFLGVVLDIIPSNVVSISKIWGLLSFYYFLTRFLYYTVFKSESFTLAFHIDRRSLKETKEVPKKDGQDEQEPQHLLGICYVVLSDPFLNYDLYMVLIDSNGD